MPSELQCARLAARPHLVWSCESKYVGRHDEGVLQAMRDHQGTGLIHVALFHDQFHDGGRGHGIQPAGGRIVEQRFGLGDDGAGNRHPAAHAARKFRGKHVHGVFQFHESQRFAHPPSISSISEPCLFHQSERHILPHRAANQKARSPGKPCQLCRRRSKSCFFAHLCDFFARARRCGRESGFIKPERQLQNRAFARSCDAKKRLGFPARQAERNAVEHHVVFKRRSYIFEDDDVAADAAWPQSRALRAAAWESTSSMDPNTTIRSCVTKKSTTMIRIIEATTAWVVERPTPCVPPRAVMSVVAADGRDDESEHHRLHQAHEDVREHQRLPGVAPVLRESRPRAGFATMLPPSRPMQVGNNGQEETASRRVATTRGVTSFFMGSVPRARMASICSVTIIEPSSLAMPEELRPATIRPVSTGPSSRTMPIDTS